MRTLLEISANTKFKIQLCKYTYVNKLCKALPRANFSRGAGACSACLHNLIYITNFINVNIPNFQRLFRAFGCHNILSITANRVASHAVRRIYIIQFT